MTLFQFLMEGNVESEGEDLEENSEVFSFAESKLNKSDVKTLRKSLYTLNKSEDFHIFSNKNSNTIPNLFIYNKKINYKIKIQNNNTIMNLIIFIFCFKKNIFL